jgi:hypothetical protein
LSGRGLKFGAGTESLAELFWSCFNIKSDPGLIPLIKKKNFNCYQFLKDSHKNYAVMYTSNLLVHIENDSETLKQIVNSLIPVGIIGKYVPARLILYSTMDKEIGYVRRHTMGDLS